MSKPRWWTTQLAITTIFLTTIYVLGQHMAHDPTHRHTGYALATTFAAWEIRHSYKNYYKANP